MTNNIELINLGFVNAFLLKAGDGFVLVDTGMASQYPQLEAALTTAGALPGRIKLVVITHGDTDLSCKKNTAAKSPCIRAMPKWLKKGFARSAGCAPSRQD